MCFWNGFMISKNLFPFYRLILCLLYKSFSIKEISFIVSLNVYGTEAV